MPTSAMPRIAASQHDGLRSSASGFPSLSNAVTNASAVVIAEHAVDRIAAAPRGCAASRRASRRSARTSSSDSRPVITHTSYSTSESRSISAGTNVSLMSTCRSDKCSSVKPSNAGSSPTIGRSFSTTRMSSALRRARFNIPTSRRQPRINAGARYQSRKRKDRAPGASLIASIASRLRACDPSRSISAASTRRRRCRFASRDCIPAVRVALATARRKPRLSAIVCASRQTKRHPP